MTYAKIAVALACILAAVCVYAGGDPEFVAFPEGLRHVLHQLRDPEPRERKTGGQNFCQRRGHRQLPDRQDRGAGLYPRDGGLQARGRMRMAIRSWGQDGVFVMDQLAAIAVMERRDDWGRRLSGGEPGRQLGICTLQPGRHAESQRACSVSCAIPRWRTRTSCSRITIWLVTWALNRSSGRQNNPPCPPSTGSGQAPLSGGIC